MSEYRSHDLLPVGTSTYDASAGMFASLDRAAKKEAAIIKTLKATISLAKIDSELAENEEHLTQTAQFLLEELKKIDKS